MNTPRATPTRRHSRLAIAIAITESLEPFRRRSERGEGIVSVAIAVLIMAGLGVVAYGAFDALFNNTTDAANNQIANIGG